MSEQERILNDSGVANKLSESTVNLGTALSNTMNTAVGVAGKDSYDSEGKTGKGLLIGYWIACGIIVIYMIVLAIIYYNNYTKYTYDETEKKWYYEKEVTNGPNEKIYYEELTEEDMITWNIHKTIMNFLLTGVGIYAVIIFVFVGTGTAVKEGKDICGANQLGWFITICIMWFIVNIVWDIKNSQFTAKEEETFCGMYETFCGSVSESFKNVSKKLRKY